MGAPGDQLGCGSQGGFVQAPRSSASGRQTGLFLSPQIPPEMCRSTWHMGQFELHEALFTGKSSKLHLAIDRQSGHPVALKMYHKRQLSPINKFQVNREISIQTQLVHENIIKLYAAFEDDKNIYLVQELATGGDLFHKVRDCPDKRLPEQQLINEIMKPFLSALCYLHDKGIIHRDIKPENMVLDADNTIKLADFGLAIDVNAERPVTRAGTLDYMAPEVLICPDKDDPMENKDQDHLAYSQQVDIWAAGVLAFELLVGRPPFEQTNSRMTFEHILKMEPAFPDWVSREARSFIKAALCKDAASRPTARQLLSHRWLTPKGSRAASSSDGTRLEAPGASSSAASSESTSPIKPAGGGLHIEIPSSRTSQSMSECSTPLSHRPPPGVLSDDSLISPSSPQHAMSRFAARGYLGRAADLAGSDRLLNSRVGGDRGVSDDWASQNDTTTRKNPQEVSSSLELSPQASKYSKIFSKLWGSGNPESELSTPPKSSADIARHLRSPSTGNSDRLAPGHNGMTGRDKSVSSIGSRDKLTTPMVGRERGLSLHTLAGREKSVSAIVSREKSLYVTGREKLVHGMTGKERSLVPARSDHVQRAGRGEPMSQLAHLRTPSLAVTTTTGGRVR